MATRAGRGSRRTGRVSRTVTSAVGADRYGAQNTLEFHAGLLARHERVEELRALAGRRAGVYLHPYVKLLERLGRAPEAEAMLRESAAVTDDRSGPHPDYHSTHRSALMGLPARQGRLDEAVEAARPTFGYLDGLGRPAEAVAALPSLAVERETVDRRWSRWREAAVAG